MRAILVLVVVVLAWLAISVMIDKLGYVRGSGRKTYIDRTPAEVQDGLMTNTLSPVTLVIDPATTTSDERAWDALARRRGEAKKAVQAAVVTVVVERRMVSASVRAALIPALPAVVTREPYLASRNPGKRVAITVVEMLALRQIARQAQEVRS